MTTSDEQLRPRTILANAAATISLLAPVARLSLRARGPAAVALSRALGVELPAGIGRRAGHAGIEALHLGPDEWLLLAPEQEAPRLIAACDRIGPDTPHSVTDISDREVSIRVEGPMAPELLALGCPRDLDRIDPGQGRRTVFDGLAVVLWRDTPESFRLDVWRSFAPHLLGLLETGCAELACSS